MELLSSGGVARLKANKRAWEHFERHKNTYKRYSQLFLGASISFKEYEQFKNEETRVTLVKTLILQLDPSIWGLKNDWMTADEIADSFARLVVGHENDP